MDEMTRCVDSVLRARRTTRAFGPAPVSAEQVREILDVASCAPSNSNTQPWRVHVLSGAPMRDLGHALIAAFQRGDVPPAAHFPDPLPQAVALRQEDFGARYYSALGIERADMQGRARQTQRNFSFFGAPVGLVFSIDRRLNAHSWLDLGLFLQNVMIAAKARGIDTCAQVAFARFHSVIARHLAMPEADVTVCGMSMGYADAAASVNRMQVPRERVQDFARFVGFDAEVGCRGQQALRGTF